ncbi:MAG: class I SAM-dependent RNA methyltransferase [Acidimicrobiales bacterium]
MTAPLVPEHDLASPETDLVELTATALVAGGEAIARDDEGRVVFVRGALPGERVRVAVTERHKAGTPRSWARGRVEAVLDPSADRVEPPCPSVAAGCGGCDLQHASPAAQPALKASLVADALRRLGGIDDPPVVVGAALPAVGFRTTVRAAVVEGRAGFRRHHDHQVVLPDSCMVTDPRLEELLVRGDFAEATEVTLRIGGATGERLAVVDPTADGVVLPKDVLVVGDAALRGGRRAWIHDEVAGRRWRISARSFFQTRTDGAEALVDAVARAAGDALAGAHVVDAYAGVGLLAGSLLDGAIPAELGHASSAVVVERSPSSIADARQNLEHLPVRVVKADVDRWRPSAADLVVADPSRSGLGKKAVTALAATGAPVLVLVSCDPAALGRDAKLLAAEGFRLERSELVDLFPQTHHAEVISRFVR